MEESVFERLAQAQLRNQELQAEVDRLKADKNLKFEALLGEYERIKSKLEDSQREVAGRGSLDESIFARLQHAQARSESLQIEINRLNAERAAAINGALDKFHAIFADLPRAYEYHDHASLEHIVNSYNAFCEKEGR